MHLISHEFFSLTLNGSVFCVFFKFTLILCLGYFLRWMDVGPYYIVVGLLAVLCWFSSREEGKKKQRLAQQGGKKPEESMASLSAMEKVLKCKTEMERKEVLNKVVADLWPYISEYLKKKLQNQIQPSICGSMSALSSFHFTYIDFGKNAPRLTSVRTHRIPARKQIILDADLTYHGDAKVNAALRHHSIKLGINGLTLEGTLRIILEPLLDDVPFVGAVTVYFPQRPVLDIKWTGLAEFLELPTLSKLSNKKVIDRIAKYLVVPNHITVPLKAGIKVEDLYYKVHRNVLRIFILEAEDLMAKDLISRKSDPYVVIHGGGLTEKTKVIYRNLNPKWNQVFEMSFSDLPGQEIEFELYDYDIEKDDFLGRCQISVEEVMTNRSIDTWLPLKNATSGKLHVKLENLSLVSDVAQLEPVLKLNQMSRPAQSKDFSSAFLYVFIERGRDLQLKDENKTPSAKAEIRVRNTVQKTKTCPKSKDPIWKETFTFFIKNPHDDMLDLQVRDEHYGSLGSITVSLSVLLSANNLTIEDWYELSQHSNQSAVRIRLQMRILVGASLTPELQPSNPSPLRIPPTHYHSVDSSLHRNVLRIFILEAEDLMAKDLISRKSDPYVVIHGGGLTEKTKVIYRNLNPKWNQVFEMSFSDLPGQEIEFELYDYDIEKDDFLGRCQISVEEVMTNRSIDTWLPLKNATSGKLHVKLENLSLVSDVAQLEPVLKLNQMSRPAQSKDFSSAFLYVFIERGRDLQLKDENKTPSAKAEIRVRNTVQKTKTCPKSKDPIWKETFTFFIKNPHDDMLDLQVRDEHYGSLGSITVSLSVLLSANNLTIEDWYELSPHSRQSAVRIRLQMRILVGASLTPELQPSSSSHRKEEKEIKNVPKKLKQRKSSAKRLLGDSIRTGTSRDSERSGTENQLDRTKRRCLVLNGGIK
uniref:Extended synaptotagmin-like protein 3 n=1 Tax=Xenopus tropicalis TaxID=8364 RepID=A0A6I8QYS9_XENTR